MIRSFLPPLLLKMCNHTIWMIIAREMNSGIAELSLNYSTCRHKPWFIVNETSSNETFFGNCQILRSNDMKEHFDFFKPLKRSSELKNKKATKLLPKLRKLTIRIAVNNVKPFITVRKRKNGQMDIFGIDAKLIKTFQEKFKFKIQILSPSDGEWGRILENVSWTGLMGMLQKQEADMAISTIAIAHDRSQIADFSTPYLTDENVLLTKTPDLKSKIYVIVRVFTKELWAVIVFSFIMAVCFLYTMGHLRSHLLQESALTFRRTFWFLFSTLVNQGCCISCFKGASTIIFLGAWLGYVLVIRVSYSGPLMSYMGFPGHEEPISTLQDVVRAIQESNYRCGTRKGTIVHDYLLELKDDLQVISDCVREDVSSTISMGTDEALVRMMTENLIWFSSKIDAQFMAKEMDIDKEIITGQSIQVTPNVIAFRKNFQYQNSFNKLIQRLVEMGIVDKWKMDAISVNPVKEDIEDADEDVNVKKLDLKSVIHEDDLKPLNITDLKGPFLFILYGHIFSIFIFISEIIFSKISTCQYCNRTS